jgi:hypothetical protein
MKYIYREKRKGNGDVSRPANGRGRRAVIFIFTLLNSRLLVVSRVSSCWCDITQRPK